MENKAKKIFFMLFLCITHFFFLLFWSYNFFNYPTLDDVARAFTYIHSFVSGKIYIYQLDLSYHGSFVLTPIYHFFMGLMGTDNIMAYRTANIVISSATLFIALNKMKGYTQMLIFFTLFTFSNVYFMRNQLLVGNYTLIPFFVVLIVSTHGFLKGFATGLAISTHPLFLPFILLVRKGEIKKFSVGFILGIAPLLLFNIYNMLYNIDKGFVLPTITDILTREEVASLSLLKGDITFKAYLLILITISLYLLLKDELYPITDKLKYIFLLVFFLLIGEERHISFFITLSIWIVSEKIHNLDLKFSVPAISFLVLISLISLFHFREDKEYCWNFVLFPYSTPHCPKYDFSKLKKDVECLQEEFRKKGVDFTSIGGDVFSTGFIKFFWPSANIYYYQNSWSYIIPEEFDGGKTIRFIIYYRRPEDNRKIGEDFLRRKIRICGFEIRPTLPLTRKNIQESLFFQKFYVRKTDIKDMISDTDSIKSALRNMLNKIKDKVRKVIEL